MPVATAPDSTAAMRRALGAVLGATPDSLAELLRTAGIDSTRWLPGAVAAAESLQQQTGRKRYTLGRRAYRRGEDATAVAELRRALALAPRAYFEDDALYLLMLASERQGDVKTARLTAQTLEREYGSSIYANSRTRRLAREPLPVEHQ
jgi:hypothetical protein